MSERSAQFYTICGCIDHCFAFAMWCEDFAKHVDSDDMMWGLDRSFEILSDATRLHSFLALRKLDGFLRAKARNDDLVAADLGIDVPTVLGDVGETFLTSEERDNVSKGVAHLTEQLTLDSDTEVDLQAILKRSIPVFSRLVAELRKADNDNEAEDWLSKTEGLIKRAQELEKKAEEELAARKAGKAGSV